MLNKIRIKYIKSEKKFGVVDYNEGVVYFSPTPWRLIKRFFKQWYKAI